MPVTADTRSIPHMDAAKSAFARFARLELDVAKADAATEVAIASIKTAHDADVTPLVRERNALACAISTYILTHRDQFQDPRSIKTDLGKFGLRDVSNLDVFDEAAVLAWAKNHAVSDVVKTTTALVKPAITKRIKSGDIIPGARISKGEEVFLTADRSLLDTIEPTASAR